jgi:hypothetical protein
MAGSNMFLVYTSANGNNVTLSPRTASGYVPPDLNSEAQVTLLEGSGVANGIMTANVKCKSTSRYGAPRTLSIAHRLIHFRLQLQQLVWRNDGLQVVERKLGLRIQPIERSQELRLSIRFDTTTYWT